MLGALKRKESAMAATVTSAVSAHGVSKSYGAGDQKENVLQDLDLTVAPGETVAVLGVSGTGKSTLLNVLGGLDRPGAGRVVVAGVDLQTAPVNRLTRLRAESIAFIFQFYNLVPTLTAFENVLAGLQAARRTTPEDEGRVMEALKSVGLQGKEAAFPSELSGGQQQRVAVARALVKRAPVILADEPTGNLDRVTAKEIIGLVVDSSKTYGAALVVVTHDPAVVAVVDRAYRLEHGHLVAE